jgi:hypothetical protein
MKQVRCLAFLASFQVDQSREVNAKGKEEENRAGNKPTPKLNPGTMSEPHPTSIILTLRSM